MGETSHDPRTTSGLKIRECLETKRKVVPEVDCWKIVCLEKLLEERDRLNSTSLDSTVVSVLIDFI